MMAKPADKTVQSGNSRVKVTLYGHINRAVRFASTQNRSELQSIDNTHAGSRIGVHASGSLNKNLTSVANIELDTRTNGRHQGDFESPAGTTIAIRHSNVSLVHKDMGTLSLGHGWLAGASAHGGGFRGTGHVFGIWGPGGDGLSATVDEDSSKSAPRHLVSYQLWGPRSSRIYYRTPNLMGASVEVSYNDDKSWSAGFGLAGLPGVKTIGLKLNAGYRSNPSQGENGSTTLAVSAGVQHVASGFSVNGTYNQEQFKGGAKPVAWMADVGWTGKLTDAGATSFGLGYGKWGDGMYGESTRYHFAINQQVVSAAADVYFGIAYDTGTYTMAAMDAVAAMAGMAEVPAAIEGLNGPDSSVSLESLADRTGGLDAADVPAGGYVYEDGEQVHAGDLTGGTPGDDVYTYKAATDLVPATEGTPAQDAQPAKSADRDGVLVIIAGIRIKF